MRRTRGVVSSLSLSMAVAAAAQLLYIPAGHAQSPAPGGEPEVQAPDSNVAPGPGPAPMPPNYRPPVAGPVVTLRADSHKARLQVQGPLNWQDVCVTPCNVAVNPAAIYRVGGGTIRGSDSFNMPRPVGQVLVDAHVGSTIKHWVGVGLLIGGALSAAGGIYYYSQADSLASSSNGAIEKGFYQGVGIGEIIVGVILLGVGIPLALSSTSVEVH
jgi:hypothetical protein